MKILLIDPPGKNKGLNTGLGYLSALLKERNEVKVLDLNNLEMGLCGDPNPDLPLPELDQRVLSTLTSFEPDLIGISIKTFTAEISKHILSCIKNKQPEVLTVVGGPHITLDGLNFIRGTNADFGILGEGEYSTQELCEALDRDGSFDAIDGILYWKKDQLIHHPRGDAIKALDAIPFPYYDTFSSVQQNRGLLREYPVLTSRGCPYKCSYCSMPTIMGGKWRSRTPEKVIAELQHAKEKYHCTSFTVVDDNFTLDLKRVSTICDLLISEKLDLPWNSQNGIRADRINEDTATKMKRSGCQYVWIGIESADEKVFDAIEKGEKLADIKKGILHLQQSGIRVGGFFITGLPFSTRESDLKSIDFVQEQGIDGFWFNFVPYPHTRAYDWVAKHGKALRSTSGMLQFGANNVNPVFETKDYPRESRRKTYNEIHVRLKYFDRLVDPSLKQWLKWRKVFKLVRPYGPKVLLALCIFILKYNAGLIKKSIQR